MSYKKLDTVVLVVDLPNLGLKAGDLGAVVELHDDNSLEIEFVAASGRTRALATLSPHEVRPIDPEDMPSVRRLSAAQ